MPQIMIDTAAESPKSLRLLAVLLTDYAVIAEKEEGTLEASYPGPVPSSVAEHAHAVAAAQPDTTAPAERQNGMLPELGAAFGMSPAEIFGKNAPPAPLVPTGTVPTPPAPQAPIPGVMNAAPSPVSGTPALPNVPTVTATASSTVSQISAPASAVEVDAAGVPWDARIHQDGRSKKADNTWKWKRGLDKALGAAVTAELLAARAGFTQAGTVPPAPVTVPLPPGTVPVPPVPGVQHNSVLAPGPVSGAVVPLPPTAATGGVSDFRAMMQKIGTALAEQQITQAQVSAAHNAVGLVQLQLAVTKPELIPSILAQLGL